MLGTKGPQIGEAVFEQGPGSLGSEAEVNFLDEALELGRRFLDQAHEAPDGSFYWLKAVADAEGKRKPLGPHLHAGYSGIALFLAALGKVTGESSFSAAASKSLGPLRLQLRGLARRPGAQEWKLGAVTGLASLVYSLFRVGTWLNEPGLIEDAYEAASLFSAQKIAEDKYCDVMYGAAGALMVLLLLDAEAPESSRARGELLDSAIACGEHLLKLKIVDKNEASGWPSPIQPPSSGFAHGAAGISLALGRLAQRTGRDDFWAAAENGLAFERLHYDPQIDNWLPVRNHKLRMVLNGWCNGAAGIALARLGLMKQLSASELRRDLQMALDSVVGAEQAKIDTVCCGNFGRADILLEASRKLDRPDLLSAAHRIAARAVLEARNHQDGYRTRVPDQLTGGFYTGLSGIGYVLVRLSGATELPCVQAVN